MLIPRGRIDASPWDLARAWGRTWSAGDGDEGRILGGRGLPLLCARAGWWALLGHWHLGEGDAVLMSALTIAEMADLVRARGAEVLGIDIDAPAAFPAVAACEDARRRAAAAGLRPRVVCVSQLFGARHSLAAIAAWCRGHGLVLVEDAAQLPVGRGWSPQPGVAASLFSHGPIKSDSAGGGGWLAGPESGLIAAVAQLQRDWPRQQAGDYRRRLGRTAGLWMLSLPFVFAAFWAWLGRVGRDPDVVLTAAIRAFPGSRDPRRFERRPHPALVATLRRALARGRRREPYRQGLVAVVARRLQRPLLGSGGAHHHGWLVAVAVDEIDVVRERLRGAGYDSGRAGNLTVVDPDRCPGAAAIHAQMLVLPDPEVQPRKVAVRFSRIAGILG